MSLHLEVSIMKIALMLILLFSAYNCWADAPRPQSSDLVGRWKIDITFEGEAKRPFDFDADDSGRGSLTMETPRDNWIEPSSPAQVKWTSGAEKRVTFFAPVEFPIGNVGREAGILVFKGEFKSENKITGDIALYPADSDPMDSKATPTKTGKFEATRVKESKAK
jgi:hypothetical protein